MYLYGTGVEKILEKAKDLFQKAANQGSNDAKNNLEIISQQEDNLLPEKVELFKQTKAKAEKGDVAAQFDLIIPALILKLSLFQAGVIDLNNPGLARICLW